MAATRIVVRGLGGQYLFAYIYETQEAMLRAAKRYSPAEWSSLSDEQDTFGCFQPAVDRDGVERSFLGVARLTLEHLDAEIIVHEMVHAAVEGVRRTTSAKTFKELLTVERIVGPDGSKVTAEIHGEELLAYQVGVFADSLFAGMALAGPDTRAVR